MLAVEIYLGEAAKENGLSYYNSLQMTRIIYAGMVNFYEVKQLPYPVSFEDIYEYVDSKMVSNEDTEELIKVIEDFHNCQAIKKKAEALKEANEEIEEIKKKQEIGIIQELPPMPQD